MNGFDEQADRANREETKLNRRSMLEKMAAVSVGVTALTLAASGEAEATTRGAVPMATFEFFNLTIAAGGTFLVHYRFSGGADRGAQYAMANPLNPGGALETYSQIKYKINDGTITYGARVRNIGSVATNWNLQGGGVV